MTTQENRWEHLGRAAEHFARRVARDARKFAERVEAHVGEFAHDVQHEWHCGRRTSWAGHEGAGEDARRVFQDIRGVLVAVLDGVDEFITRAFHEQGEERWARIVCNHDVTCGKCGRAVAAGQEAHVRRTAEHREFRCLDCGVPGGSP